MKKLLYLECANGISGDMTVAALCGLTGAFPQLKELLEAMLPSCRVSLEEAESHHVRALRFRVEAPHEHAHRHLSDVRKILRSSALSPRALALAEKIFGIVAEAEGAAHGIDPKEVHFHEVGAVDSICDVAGAAFLLDKIGAGEVIVPALTEGCGTIACAHGELPIPVPAVVNIVRNCALSLKITGIPTELVTPTGAAIAGAVRTTGRLPENFRILECASACGTRDVGRPNVFRAMLLTEDAAPSARNVWQMECNLDDMTGEALAPAMESILQAGALDVSFSPLMMKKNRPAVLLRILCTEENRPGVESAVFACTTAMGLRRVRMERTVLEKRPRIVHLPCGEAVVNESVWEGRHRFSPEFESVRELSGKSGIPFDVLYRELIRACEA